MGVNLFFELRSPASVWGFSLDIWRTCSFFLGWADLKQLGEQKNPLQRMAGGLVKTNRVDSIMVKRGLSEERSPQQFVSLCLRILRFYDDT